MTSGNKNIPKELLSPTREFVEASERIGLYWWYWNHQNRSLSMSPAFLKVLGYTEKEFDPSKPSIYRNIHPDDASENLSRIRKLLSGEVSRYEIDYRIRDKNGNWTWYYNRGTVIERDPEGKVILVGGISMDMSGQFTHMLSKVQATDKFEFIFRNTNEAVVIFELLDDRAGRIVDANKAAMKLFGKSEKDLNHPISAEAIQDELIGESGLLFKEVLEKGFGRVEQKIELDDGKILWLDISAHSFTITGEKLVIAIVTDRTPVKMTEAALRESERLYRTLFDAADDRISLVTVSRKPILMNASFYESLGYTREEFFAMDPDDHVHPDDRGIMAQVAESTLKKGSGTLDYRARHKEGHYLHMAAKIVVIKGEPDEEDLVLFIIRDVTDRKRAMRDLEMAKTQAEESDKLKSAFLANMSHEIRTPMNSIVGFSNLLAGPDVDEATRMVYVNRIIRNSGLLLTLISDIIDLAKIESGQLSIVYGQQRISDLISDLEQYTREELDRLDKSYIAVSAIKEDGDCLMETDLIRTTQVMKNLINNAIKFTDEGTIKIGCRLKDSGENVVLFVEDTGVGISKDHFELIFDQFRQVDGSNTRKFGGTGLGLAICRNLVEMMGGRIWVESEPGRGSLFQVEMPLNVKGKVSLESRDVNETVPGRVSPEPEIGAHSILVVDDQPDTLELFRYMLTSLGHSVMLATNGYEALKKLERSPQTKIVFMDVQMPVMSGTETLRLIKDRYPDVRVVAQSAHALAGDRERFMEDGYDGYLPKPFTEEQLTRLLSSAFSG